MKQESIRLSPEKIPSLLRGDYLLLAADVARRVGGRMEDESSSIILIIRR